MLLASQEVEDMVLMDHILKSEQEPLMADDMDSGTGNKCCLRSHSRINCPL